jgi:hypothetical protein
VGFAVDKVALVEGFLLVVQVSLVNIIPPMHHSHFHERASLTRTSKGANWNFQKAFIF